MNVRRYPWWFLTAFSAGLGAVCLAAFWVGGNLDEGLIAFGILAGFGLVFAFGGRSELIRGLRGDGRDEYWEGLDTRASLAAGLVLILVVIGLCLWEWAHGRSGSPYTQLGAVAGVAYLVALAILRVRR